MLEKWYPKIDMKMGRGELLVPTTARADWSETADFRLFAAGRDSEIIDETILTRGGTGCMIVSEWTKDG